MAGRPLASVIVNNYNYARFLGDAVESALGQTYPDVEVVVVDDGSTDESREVIARFGTRVVPVLKANGGQESALNAGLAASRGDVVCFLDSDDLLAPTALERGVARLEDPGVAKVHWPLWAADPAGRPTGRTIPAGPLPEGDLQELVVRHGPYAYATSGTNGAAWARRFLERVFPLRPSALRSGTAEAYLSMLAPLFGRVAAVAEPQGHYRMHGGNNYWGRSLEKLALVLEDYERDARLLARLLEERGIAADLDAWRRGSWFHRLHRALVELRAAVPPGETFLLVDADEWGVPDTLDGRRRMPFPERGGLYWGPPADDDAAIGELERLRAAGVRYVAVAWPAFWWLGFYPAFRRHLRARFPVALENDRLVVFGPA
jgi:glycosyltransferase involved in cell wall biosynthesis